MIDLRNPLSHVDRMVALRKIQNDGRWDCLNSEAACEYNILRYDIFASVATKKIKI